MNEERDQKRLDALRERLYSRGNPPKKAERVKLTDVKEDVPTAWPEVTEARERGDTAGMPPKASPGTSIMAGLNKGKYSYRVKILMTALFFFVAAVMLSSLFILFGGNTISGENISVSLNGPFAVGGGEELSIQAGITNHNSVSIESATLIVEYPRGTQSADPDEEGQGLFVERIPLNAIRSGETVNVPLRARVFGEEGEEHTIHASVEYRVAGSNATFFKEAEPLRFKISSSPVSLEVDAVKEIASGQEAEIQLIVNSNSPTALQNILVRAEYPSGFDYTSSSPNPVSGQNTWVIEELEPEGSATISITGAVVGTESDTRVMHFSVGVPNERDRFTLASVFSTATAELTVEQPFLDVSVSVDGSDHMAIEPGEQSNVEVEVENTLGQSVYNAVVEAELSGNALSDVDVRVPNGFYDSNTRKVVWDASSMPELQELAPGARESFRFVVTPNTGGLRTPQINIEASVRAERVRESNVSEALVGSARASIKVASEITLLGETGYDTPAFSDNGPIPPVVGQTTSYTITLRAAGGSNDVTGAVVSSTLPSYVTWLGSTAGDGSVEYSSGNRSLTWNIGNIDANGAATAAFQVSLLPSASQIDTTPTLLEDQHLRAEDRFTGSVLRASSDSLTTRLPSEAGYTDDDGRVQAN